MIVNKYAKPGNQLEGQRQVAIKSENVSFQPNVEVSWNFIDLTRQPSINSAADSLRQQKLLFDVSARNLVLNLQQTYYAIQSSKQLIDSSRQIYAINQEQLRYLEAQKTIGMVTVLDLEQTRAQLYNQLIQLVAYTQSYIEQTAQLAEFLALPEGSLAIPGDANRGRFGSHTIPAESDVATPGKRRRPASANSGVLSVNAPADEIHQQVHHR